LLPHLLSLFSVAFVSCEGEMELFSVSTFSFLLPHLLSFFAAVSYDEVDMYNVVGSGGAAVRVSLLKNGIASCDGIV
jgi:hypothetical protein